MPPISAPSAQAPATSAPKPAKVSQPSDLRRRRRAETAARRPGSRAGEASARKPLRRRQTPAGEVRRPRRAPRRRRSRGTTARRRARARQRRDRAERVPAHQPAQEAGDRALLGRVVDRQALAAVRQHDAAGRAQHGRLRRAGGQFGADEPEQRRAGHVRADRLRRRPRHPRQPDERLERRHLVLDRAQDLLLAAGAREVVLLRVALVLARAGERERLLAVDLLLAALQPQRVAAVLEAAVDPREHAAAAIGRRRRARRSAAGSSRS